MAYLALIILVVLVPWLMSKLILRRVLIEELKECEQELAKVDLLLQVTFNPSDNRQLRYEKGKLLKNIEDIKKEIQKA